MSPCRERARFEAPDRGLPAGMLLERVTLDGFADGAAPIHMSRWGLQPGACSLLDAHPDREVWMIVAGSGELTIDGTRTVQVSAGEVYQFDSHVGHHLRNTGTVALSVFSVWWMNR